MRTAALGAAVASLCLVSPSASAADPVPTTIRVGVVEYDNFAKSIQAYREYLQEVQKAARPQRLNFRLAVGTYSEVLNWYNSQTIDVAILTPGPVAHLLTSSRDEIVNAYIATRTLPPAVDTVFSEPDRTQLNRAYDYYHAAAIVPKDSAIADVNDLIARMKRGAVTFLVVHPMSVSSFVYPVSYFKDKHGVSLESRQVEFTYSHQRSIQRIAEASTKERDSLVAFIYDGMDLSLVGSSLERVRKLDLPGFSQEPLPQNVALVNFRSPDAAVIRDAMRKLLTTVKTSRVQFGDYANHTTFGDRGPWHAAYDKVINWWHAVELNPEDERSAKVTFRDVVDQLNVDQDNRRLALVFSGGGAKCAYQVGALETIDNPAIDNPLTYPAGKTSLSDAISLVVGTSGGALNALAVALGVTTTQEGRDLLRNLWISFDQSDFVIPWDASRWTLGLSVALGIAAITFVVLCRRKRAIQIVLGACILVSIVVGLSRVDLARHLPEGHWWSHLVLLLVIADQAAWLCLIAPAILAFFVERPLVRVTVGLGCAVLSLVFAIVCGYVTLYVNESITRSYGVEHAVAHAVPKLIDMRLRQMTANPDTERVTRVRQRLQPLIAQHERLDASIRRRFGLPVGAYGEELETLSRIILEEHLLIRDLIITGSKVGIGTTGHKSSAPDDLYFYAHGTAKDYPVNDRRFVSLDADEGRLNSPEQLLDVIVGSTSIFPIFPSRELARRDYTIVDGGFAHNIPVEAAARWGASQILVVEASPADEGAQRGNAFVSNAKAAFDLLFAEAQQVDVSLRGTLPLSALRPTPAACGGPQSYTALDLFDFSPRLLSRAIDFGMSQAKCEQPTYDRVWLTTPNFVEVATRVK